MFEVRETSGGLRLIGRLDASQVDSARSAFDRVTVSCAVDFSELEYISSAGLGMLLSVQKRLRESGNELRLTQMNRHIREIFRLAGFDHIFEIR